MNGQPSLARHLESFFHGRLTQQRNATHATVAAYRDALRLLVLFASKRTGKKPCTLAVADLDQFGDRFIEPVLQMVDEGPIAAEAERIALDLVNRHCQRVARLGAGDFDRTGDGVAIVGLAQPAARNPA